MKRIVVLAAVLVLIVVVIVSGALWLKPSGVGEHKSSPDGLWRARVAAMSRGTWSGSRDRYVELRLDRLANGSTVWQQEIPHTAADMVPDYGDRIFRFIVWASNSTQFTVTTTNGATSTVTLAAVLK